MKKNILGIGLIMVIALAACAQQKKVTKNTSTKNTSVSNNKEVTALTTSASPNAGDINFIQMRRGGCFGKCPSYTIELNKDGRVVYMSHMFTEYEGTFEKNIGADKVIAVMNEFEKYRVDTCGTYKNMIPDLPPLTYNVKFANKEVTIYNANFGPKFLVELSKKVDDLGKVDKTWKKTAEAVKPK